MKYYEKSTISNNPYFNELSILDNSFRYVRLKQFRHKSSRIRLNAIGIHSDGHTYQTLSRHDVQNDCAIMIKSANGLIRSLVLLLQKENRGRFNTARDEWIYWGGKTV